jgi:hypothetical protein
MTDINLSRASRRIAADLGLTNHQQHIFSWVSEKRGWTPGRSGNYSTPSGTLRDVQAVAKKGHLVLTERGSYVVAEHLQDRISALVAELRTEEKAKQEARQAEHDARRFVVVLINLADGSSQTVGEVHTGRGGHVSASNESRRRLADDADGQYKFLVVELG